MLGEGGFPLTHWDNTDPFLDYLLGYSLRGGEWYPENRGSRKLFIGSRNLGSFCDESRSLVFHVFLSVSESRIFFAKSRSLGFAFLAEVLRQKLSR